MVAAVVFVGSAWLVAVTLTVCGVLMTEGAVYIPFDRVPTGEGNDHVTAVFPLPVTVGENCVLCDGVSVAFKGLKVMLRPLGTS